MGIFDLFKPSIAKLEANEDVDGLIQRLENSNDGTDQNAAAEALGRIGDKRAIEPLIKFLLDEKCDYKAVMAEALGRIGDKRAIEPLIQALWKDECSFHKIAANALVNLGWEPRNDNEKAYLLIALGDWGKVIEMRDAALEPLMSIIKKKKFSDRLTAAKVLGQIGGEGAVDPLIYLLKDQDQNVRDVAAYWLGEIKNRRAIEPLIQLMQTRDYISVRHTAAQSLEKIGDTSAIGLMKEIENESEAEGRALFQRTWGR